MNKIFPGYTRMFTLSLVLLCGTLAYGQNVPGTETQPAGSTATFPVPPDLQSEGARFNYTRNYAPVVPVTNSNDVSENSPASDVKISTTYRDGFNRGFQTIIRNYTNNANRHLVIPVDTRTQVDAFSYLPYATANDNSINPDPSAFYRVEAFDEQKAFYNDKYPNEGYSSFSRSQYISDAGQRVLKSYAPGKSQVGQNRATLTQSIANDAGIVRIWTVSSSGQLQSPGFYPADVLYGAVTTNTDGAEVTAFKDKEGHVIYQKEYLSNIISGPNVTPDYGITYNVYDELGQLRFTLPPAATALASAGTLSQAQLDNLCFQYTYNDKGQLTRKKVPGKQPELYIYDKLGRTVLYQDGNLASGTKKWLFTIFDKKGRSLCSGTWQNSATQQALQASFYDNSTYTPADLFYYQKNYELSGQYPPAITGADILSYNYYDDYSQTDPNEYYWGTFAANNLFASERLNTIGAEIPERGLSAMGLPTGSKVKILPAPGVGTSQTGDWRETVTFYDNKRRPIYTLSRDVDQGQAKHTHAIATQYDFAGRVLSAKHIATNANSTAGNHKEVTRNYYDDLSGRLTKTEHKMNAGTWNVLALYTYDELGRVKRKVLGNYGEVRDYSYNIRGQLEGINPVYALTGNKEGESRSFGEALRYDYGFTVPRYDGKVSGMVWRGANAAAKNAYGYRYDPGGRLTAADYRKWESGTISNPYSGWYNNHTDYSVSNLSYDRNGNIKSMKQRGMGIVNGSAVPVDIDDLTYNYETDGNKLGHVTDNATVDYGNGDFQNTNGANNDYHYDPNGNLDLDKNKGIEGVTYNYLNKPVTVTVGTSGNKISYSYDATGNKVQEVSTVNGVSTTTDYVGNFVYKNNELQYALTPEGRSVYTPSLPGLPSFREEFFVKDHLDNVRSVIDVFTYPIQQYLASYEVASANLEGLFFDQMEEVRDDKPGGTPGDNKAGNLNGEDPSRRIGTSTLLKVMAGDKVELNVNNYYESYNAEEDHPVSVEDMLGTLVSTLTGGSGGFIGSESHDSKLVNDLLRMDNFGQYNDLLTQNTDPSKPKAYLNYILFDEGMKIVREMSGSFQSNGAGSWAQIGTTAPLTIPANGYLAVYLSNSSALGCGSCGDVFFDQLVIRMSSGKLKEESHYYPFGLPIGSMGSAAAGFKENKHKYQSNEYNKELGLNWMNFQNRQYDPQLGRFLSIDPLAAATPTMSPYVAMNNDPVSVTDPLGLQGAINMDAPMVNVSPAPIWPFLTPPPSSGGSNLSDFFIQTNGKQNEQYMQMKMQEQRASAWAALIGEAMVGAQGGTPGITGNMTDGFTINGTSIEGKKQGFFGKLWSGVKNAWNSFGNTLGGAMDGIHNWMNRKLGHEADVRRDKTYDKDGGGTMLTGEDGGYGEGRSVGQGDLQPLNVDDMGILFSHGGSGGSIPAGDIAELIDRANEIYGRFTDGNGLFDFMKPDAMNGTYKPYWEVDGKGIRTMKMQGVDTNYANQLLQQYIDSVNKGLIPVP